MGLTVEEVGRIYRRHADVVYRRCLAMLGGREAALDAVQEIFARILSHRLRFRGDADPTTWIYRITTNYALNQLRSRRRVAELEHVQLSLHPRFAGPEAQVVTRDALARLLARLDKRGRAIVFLHFVDGLDQDEVAAVLGITRRAVVKRLTRLRASLARGDLA